VSLASHPPCCYWLWRQSCPCVPHEGVWRSEDIAPHLFNFYSTSNGHCHAQWRGRWVGPRADLDALEKRKLLIPVENRTAIFFCLFCCSPSHYTCWAAQALLSIYKICLDTRRWRVFQSCNFHTKFHKNRSALPNFGTEGARSFADLISEPYFSIFG
jgi:hypothetical protein